MTCSELYVFICDKQKIDIQQNRSRMKHFKGKTLRILYW